LIGTDLDAEMTTRTTAFVRIPFSSPDPALFDRLTLSVQYDDGFVAFLNGREVASANAMPTDQLTWQSAATDIAADLSIVEIDVTGQLHDLNAGQGQAY
jgi:hypothetical protein